MDPLDFLEPEELLRFFHCHKTELSCVERPRTLLNQLRDHNLIPEGRYKKMSHMKSKDNLRNALYDYLDWLEAEQSQHITDFWRCMFKEIILNQYPTLKRLRDSLMDGSFKFYTKLPEKIEETDKGRKKQLSEDEQDEETQVIKKRKSLRSNNVCDDDEEESGPSTQPNGASPLKKGEKGDIWTWPIYKSQLPVTCGEKEGMLNRERLAKGEKCIAVGKRWFTPTQFERFAGMEKYKNWKISIRCNNIPLKVLIKDGHLKAVSYKRGDQTAKKELFPGDFITVSDREDEEDSSPGRSSTNISDDEEEETEETQQPGVSTDATQMVYKVTCGDQNAVLHVKRFASGIRGKSIRTETKWMTPEEFVNSVLGQTESSWRKIIKWDGNPISVLIEKKILRIHSLLCTCRLCRPDKTDLEDQKNDDECCICRKEEDLVLCDDCPRAFHQTCHLPHVEDATLRDDRPWVCTFCVFRTAQRWMFPDKLRREAVMSRQISERMLGCQYLLMFLFSADEEQTFEEDPRLYLADYSTLINTPMWLKRIAEKLEDKLYQNIGEFVADVHLIFTNCALYNQRNAKYLTMGNTLKELFEEELKKVFKIEE
ncbi:nuclear body protein SP140-like protein isoform X2 [Halichoeres trimaculatus]|uniref:nuclear body protein SP140-like protein isoform X2 n=1 Tax=Halichoeres trimaculatus TaxID=147232 RepID=UPI003D9DC6A0